MLVTACKVKQWIAFEQSLCLGKKWRNCKGWERWRTCSQTFGAAIVPSCLVNLFPIICQHYRYLLLPRVHWNVINFACKKGVSTQHTTFTSCQNAACSKEFFSLVGTCRLCSGGLRFDWAKYVIFSAYFELTKRSWHTYWFSAVKVVIVSWWCALPSDARTFF